MYQQICQNIIRPQRQQYRIARLGSNQLTIKSKVTNQTLNILREDDTILNNYNQKIHLSYFSIRNLQKKPPCIIYLHANNGSRSEGIPYLKPILEQQISIVLFDCTGSGMSDGEYVTLGLRESEDLAKVIEFLATKKQVNDIALWGRSMGAVAALIFCSRNNSKMIKACIYDSPFSSLRKLVKQLANQKTGIPELFFEMFMEGLDSELIRKAHFCLEDLNVLKRLDNIKIPAVFITSDADVLVKSNHVEELFTEYKGEKYFERISSQHHESRPAQTIEKCIKFLKSKFSQGKIVSHQKLSSNIGIPNKNNHENKKNIQNPNINISEVQNPNNQLKHKLPIQHHIRNPTVTNIPTPLNTKTSTTNKTLNPVSPDLNTNKNESLNQQKDLITNKQSQNKNSQNVEVQMNKRFKDLNSVIQQKSSPIMCFLREGCWENYDDYRQSKKGEEESQAARGISNWKTMIEKNQKATEEYMVNKTHHSAKVSLKRALAQPSVTNIPANRTQHQSLPPQSQIPALPIPQIAQQPTSSHPNSHPPTQRQNSQSQPSHKAGCQPGSILNNQRLQTQQSIVNNRTLNVPPIATSFKNQTIPKIPPRIVPLRK